jgi:hypothetical protein
VKASTWDVSERLNEWMPTISFPYLSLSLSLSLSVTQQNTWSVNHCTTTKNHCTIHSHFIPEEGTCFHLHNQSLSPLLLQLFYLLFCYKVWNSLFIKSNPFCVFLILFVSAFSESENFSLKKLYFYYNFIQISNGYSSKCWFWYWVVPFQG